MKLNMSILNITPKSIDHVILKNQILAWIKEYTYAHDIMFSDQLNSDGKYIIDAENVVFKNKISSLTNDMFVWGFISGNFDCSDTKISSLEGAPEEVNGDFNCSYTQITSLKGAPKEVRGSFYCSHTNISSLEGAPKEVRGDFDCRYTQIISLKGAPEKIGGDFKVL